MIAPAPTVPTGFYHSDEPAKLAIDPTLVAQRVSAAATLDELSKDFVLFSHGAFYVFSGIEPDPVLRYLSLYSDRMTGPVSYLTADFPIFDGFHQHGVSHEHVLFWQRHLACVLKEDWPGLLSYLAQCSAINHDKKFFAYPIWQADVPVVDWVAMRRWTGMLESIPIVLVHLFGLNSNRCCLHFRPSLRPPFERVTLIKDPPEDNAIVLADLIARGDANSFVGSR